MEKLTVIKSKAVPWLQPDVDTDVIIPMRRCVNHMDTLERYAFEAYRYLGGNADIGALNPEFPLNQERYRDAKIMITGENFGCGSSRETAAEAIRRCGYRCLIGKGFSTIFTKNCFQQGILPVTLAAETVDRLAEQAEAQGIFTVDLKHEQILAPDGEELPFEVNPYRQQGLLQGLDDIDLTLLKKDRILAFYDADRERRPWLYRRKEVR